MISFQSIKGKLHLKEKLSGIIKDISSSTGVLSEHFFRTYHFMYEPKQLVFLTECIKHVSPLEGSFVEVGCAYGATTVFLKRFMDDECPDRKYYAIDTFSGFVSNQANYEIEFRNKPCHLSTNFSNNKKKWFDKSMSVHGVHRVKSIESDATKFDFKSISPISFCLLDIDLYLPIKDTLPKIYASMSPGGIIVVDDCQPHELWDGAYQAYGEFCKENNLQQEIVCKKLGILRKPL